MSAPITRPRATSWRRKSVPRVAHRARKAVPTQVVQFSAVRRVRPRPASEHFVPYFFFCTEQAETWGDGSCAFQDVTLSSKCRRRPGALATGRLCNLLMREMQPSKVTQRRICFTPCQLCTVTRQAVFLLCMALAADLETSTNGRL